MRKIKMTAKKIDLSNFTQNELRARLLNIVREFKRKDILFEPESAIIQWGKDTFDSNFTMLGTSEQAVQHLLLYCMGNETNNFSKVLGV